jgi:hypothetical protein
LLLLDRQEATMKRLILGVVAAVTVALTAPRADAKLAAVYGSGFAGFMSENTHDAGLGLMAGARIFIFDGYIDYTNFAPHESVSRAILGLRAGFGHDLRLVFRGGAGTVYEENGALAGFAGGPSRTGGVVRGGAALEGALGPMLYLGFGFDAERYRFRDNDLGIPAEGSDLFAALRATFEVGI